MSGAGDEVRLWTTRVRTRHSRQAARYTPAQTEAAMAVWIGLLEPLGFEEHEDRVRFLSLSVLLTPEQQRSSFLMGVLQRTIDNTDWEPKQRLDFIYKHLVGRPAVEREEDFGPRFRL